MSFLSSLNKEFCKKHVTDIKSILLIKKLVNIETNYKINYYLKTSVEQLNIQTTILNKG